MESLSVHSGAAVVTEIGSDPQNLFPAPDPFPRCSKNAALVHSAFHFQGNFRGSSL